MKPNNHLNWKSCFGTCSNTPLVETQGWTWATSKVFRPLQQRPPPAMTWWRWSPLPAPTRPPTRLVSFLQMANLKLFTNGCEKIFHLGQLQVQISPRWPSSSPSPLLPSAHLSPKMDFDFNFPKKKNWSPPGRPCVGSLSWVQGDKIRPSASSAYPHL